MRVEAKAGPARRSGHVRQLDPPLRKLAPVLLEIRAADGASGSEHADRLTAAGAPRRALHGKQGSCGSHPGSAAREARARRLREQTPEPLRDSLDGEAAAAVPSSIETRRGSGGNRLMATPSRTRRHGALLDQSTTSGGEHGLTRARVAFLGEGRAQLGEHGSGALPAGCLHARRSPLKLSYSVLGPPGDLCAVRHSKVGAKAPRQSALCPWTSPGIGWV